MLMKRLLAENHGSAIRDRGNRYEHSREASRKAAQKGRRSGIDCKGVFDRTSWDDKDNRWRVARATPLVKAETMSVQRMRSDPSDCIEKVMKLL